MAKKEKTAGEEIREANRALQEDLEAFQALWRKRKVSRLNCIKDPGYCGRLTVRELAAIAFVDTVSFPKGLDTPICIGDFEGNFCTNVLSIATGGANDDHLCICGDPHGEMQ